MPTPSPVLQRTRSILDLTFGTYGNTELNIRHSRTTESRHGESLASQKQIKCTCHSLSQVSYRISRRRDWEASRGSERALQMKRSCSPHFTHSLTLPLLDGLYNSVDLLLDVLVHQRRQQIVLVVLFSFSVHLQNLQQSSYPSCYSTLPRLM